MSKHTPGPWELRQSAGTRRDIHVYKGKEWIASAASSEANAALIAASPELLEALELAAERIAELERWAGMPASATQAECLAAIAKAKGGK